MGKTKDDGGQHPARHESRSVLGTPRQQTTLPANDEEEYWRQWNDAEARIPALAQDGWAASDMLSAAAQQARDTADKLSAAAQQALEAVDRLNEAVRSRDIGQQDALRLSDRVGRVADKLGDAAEAAGQQANECDQFLKDLTRTYTMRYGKELASIYLDVYRLYDFYRRISSATVYEAADSSGREWNPGDAAESTPPTATDMQTRLEKMIDHLEHVLGHYQVKVVRSQPGSPFMPNRQEIHPSQEVQPGVSRITIHESVRPGLSFADGTVIYKEIVTVAAVTAQTPDKWQRRGAPNP